jgi:hypothetical protein
MSITYDERVELIKKKLNPSTMFATQAPHKNQFDYENFLEKFVPAFYFIAMLSFVAILTPVVIKLFK